MSESSNDTDLSGGWAIISNEGSDIETLGSEAAAEIGAEPLHRSLVEETKLQHTQNTAPATCVDEKGDDSPNVALEEPTMDETLFAPEDTDDAAGKESVTMCSLSDGSDILTLGDLKEEEHVDTEENEVVDDKDLYLGTSCSSQYAFTSTDTVFPAQQASLIDSSSSEDEAGQSPNTVLRRRRVRKNTPTSIVTEPEHEEEEALDSSPTEEVEEEEVNEEEPQNEEVETRPAPSQDSSLLNKCILLALVVAFSMSFGHFHGVKQMQERQRVLETFRLTELDGVRDVLLRHVQGKHPVSKDGFLDLKNLDELEVFLLLTDVIEKMNKENQDNFINKMQTQAQVNDLEARLQQTAGDKRSAVAQLQKLAAENQQLKNSLEREEMSTYMLQEELGRLHSEMRHFEATRAAAESAMSENHRLKEQLEEKKQRMRNLQVQREELMAEVQELRTKLDKRKKVMAELRSMLNSLRSHSAAAGKQADREAEEQQSRLMELEKRLSFEQQRSDLFERLYVETKEERLKGDTR